MGNMAEVKQFLNGEVPLKGAAQHLGYGADDGSDDYSNQSISEYMHDIVGIMANPEDTVLNWLEKKEGWTDAVKQVKRNRVAPATKARFGQRYSGTDAAAYNNPALKYAVDLPEPDEEPQLTYARGYDVTSD